MAALISGLVTAAAVAIGGYNVMKAATVPSPSVLPSPPPSIQQEIKYHRDWQQQDVPLVPRTEDRASFVDRDTLLDGQSVESKYIYVDATTPQYRDQDWDQDCGSASCPVPRGLGLPQYSEPGLPMGSSSYLDDVMTDPGRTDDQWINVEPTPTKSEPWYNTGILDPLNIPTHGEKNAGTTDLQYWGPTDFDSVRHDLTPAYLRNPNLELNGKEINRPPDYFTDWEQNPGDEKVEWATGSFSGFTPNVRLQGLNRNYRFATFRDPDRPQFPEPVRTGNTGTGKPPQAAEINFGNRVVRIFADIWQHATGAKGRQAPPMLADITLPGATRRNTVYPERMGDAGGHTGGVFGGISENPVKGGRTSMKLPWSYRTQVEGPRGGGEFGGLASNPVKGGRASMKLPWSYRTQVEGSHGGGEYGGMDANPVKGGRESQKIPWSYRTQVEGPRGGGDFGGMEANPVKGGRMGLKLPWSYRTQVEGPRAGGEYGGMESNPVEGGRESRLLPWSFRVGVDAAHGNGIFGGMVSNPVQGGGMRRNPQEIWDTTGPAGAKAGTGGGDDMDNNKIQGYRPTKMPGDVPAYKAPRGGISGFGGEDCVGTVDPLRRVNMFPYPIRMGGRGGGGKTEVRSEQRIRGNMVLGTRGGDVTTEPPIKLSLQVRESPLFHSIISERSEDSLGDLFDVQHG
jgi:hypothetical protein